MTGGRLAPRFRHLTAAARAEAAATLAALRPEAKLIGAGNADALTVTACRDTRTGAPLLTVGTPYRVGRIVGGPHGHWSGGPRHDTAARSVAATAYGVRMTARLVARWDAEDGGTLSVYALTDTAEAPHLARRTVAVHADGARCTRATDTADCPRGHEYLTAAEAAERGAL